MARSLCSLRQIAILRHGQYVSIADYIIEISSSLVLYSFYWIWLAHWMKFWSRNYDAQYLLRVNCSEYSTIWIVPMGSIAVDNNSETIYSRTEFNSQLWLLAPFVDELSMMKLLCNFAFDLNEWKWMHANSSILPFGSIIERLMSRLPAHKPLVPWIHEQRAITWPATGFDERRLTCSGAKRRGRRKAESYNQYKTGIMQFFRRFHFLWKTKIKLNWILSTIWIFYELNSHHSELLKVNVRCFFRSNR